MFPLAVETGVDAVEPSVVTIEAGVDLREVGLDHLPKFSILKAFHTVTDRASIPSSRAPRKARNDSFAPAMKA